MDKMSLSEVFDRMDKLHVVVIGDVMLDCYWLGDVERISPEAPVPVIALKKRESRLGGAANVALNCKMLGAKVTVASVIGDDDEGGDLSRLLQQANIGTELVQKSKMRVTTTKTRIMGRHQQMMRLDAEVCDDLYTEEEHPFIDAVLKYLQIQKPDVVILEDYNKGVLKENVIHRITAHCKELGIVTTVDPKQKNFLAYKNITLFKPNLKEVREGLHLHVQPTVPDLNNVHEVLKKSLNHQITFITLSEHGVYYHNHNSAIIPSHLRNIADVSGAGDTVIATASMVYAITKDAHLMAEISNIAGGLVCEEVGVVPINKKLLLEESLRLISQS